MTFAAALSALGTRISFLTLAWLLLAGSMSLRDVAIVCGAQLLGYLIFRQVAERVSPVPLGADLLSMLALGAIGFFTGNLVAVAALAGWLGALRGFGDRSTEHALPSTSDTPRREGLARFGMLLLGLAVGAATMWLGPLALLWANAMIFAVAAALRVLAKTPDVLDSEATNGDNVSQLQSDPLVRRLAVTLFATNLFAQAAAVVLVVVWVSEVTRTPRMLGLVGVAFALGLLGAALANARLVQGVGRLFVLGLGVLVGGGTLLVIGGRPAVLLLVVIAAMVAGVATASVIPVIATMLSAHVPVSLRSRVDGALSSIAYLGIPLGTAAAAWFLARPHSVPLALGAAAAVLLVALLIPVFAFRTWRQLLPDAPVVLTGNAKLPARLTVMLAYANGQWVVEVRRGRALLGSRHLVRSAEALNMLSVLDVPGVHDSVEKALTVDQTEATRQADRMRSELSELEAKLAGLTEMVEITETHRPPKPRESTDAEVTST
ncbi:hypothetical protein Rhe02_48230 [Rhizocola hellebori]|uniref:MFS transporter n=1 Tax=Rhizocola hellebori TaxID=1392758 RepID=A0A8J3QC21_9ACTN|nr:hypothetical protein [Rhizocola hellebori]GIH06756.1 hypothetical protein Rhe02_48230 [Rhizocola hellebori]